MPVGWCVTVEVAVDGDRPGEERLTCFLDELAELHGAVVGSEERWSATVTVDAASPDEARGRAVDAVLAGARRCGLPDAPVVRIEVVREDVRDAELEQSTLPSLVSGPEAAEILQVSKQRVHQLAATHPEFPSPLYELAAGKLWTRGAIEAFGASWTRKPGRPPRPSGAAGAA